MGRLVTEPPPEALDAAIIFAPVGALVPEALSRVAPGGIVVCAGIHMSDIPVVSVQPAVGRARASIGGQSDAQDARDFLAVAEKVPLKTRVKEYPLHDANRALSDLREGHIEGAAVLVP